MASPVGRVPAPPAKSTAPTSPSADLEPFARGPVLSIAVVVGAVLAVLSVRYGYLSDELYFLAAGKFYLAWGYMDQQPLVPLLARAVDGVLPGSLPAFRLPALIVTVLGVVVTALLARELGGDRRAQTLAAAAYPLAPWLLLSGHWLAAATLEPLQWSAVLWLLVRWTRLHAHGIDRDRLLLWIGLVAAVALQTKFQVAVLCTALLISVAAAGPRPLLRRPALWAGVALALGTAAPALLWQAGHDWPALDMGGVVGSETNRLLFLPTALLYAGLPVGAVLVLLGWWSLLRSPALRPYRFLGWAVTGIVLFFLVVSGRPNYLSGLYGLLFAAAVVSLRKRRGGVRRSPRWVPCPVYLVSALLPVALLPIYPLPLLARHPELPSYSRLYETGWPELAHTVAETYHALPPEVRDRTAIVGETYHLTGAVDVQGRRLGLPRAYSPHRGYWFFGSPPEHADVVLFVGAHRPLAPYFRRAQRLAVVESPLLNLAQGTSVTLYEEPVMPWHQLWPRLRTG